MYVWRISHCIKVYHAVSEYITFESTQMIDKTLYIRQLERIKPDTDVVVESILR